MAGFELAFVDQVSASPTYRLDLNNSNPLATMADGTDFGMPELRKARSSTLLTDGDFISASAYGNRLLRLRIDLPFDKDQAAIWFQKIAREVNRRTNILRYRAGTTDPVFFRTYRSEITSVEWDGVASFCTVTLEADYAGVGLLETLPAATVYNDPAMADVVNANPFFEIDASGWTTTGGTLVRTTAQFHEGVASGQFTPDGVTANVLATSAVSTPVNPGQPVRFSAWLRCAVARTVLLQARWRDTSDAFMSSTDVSIALAANTWTFFDGLGNAPAGAAGVRIAAAMAGTPPAGNVLFIDEAKLRVPTADGGLGFTVSNVKGDVDAPLFLKIGSSAFSGITVTRRMVIGARRRGTPSAAPFAIQAESMTLGTDTTLPGNDGSASGPGSNYARVTTWTNPALVPRLTIDPYPVSASVDVRGTYKVFARIKGDPSGAGGAQLQLRWGVFGSVIQNDAVTVNAGITNTAWGLVELGLIQYPLGTDPGTDGLSNADLPVRGMRIELAVAKGASTVNVDIDYLVFVPADDTYAIVSLQRDTTATAAVADPARRIAYMIGSSGEVRSTTGFPLSIAGLLPSARPGVTNRYVVLLDINVQNTGDSIFDTTTITPYYWPLYLFVRPVGS